MKPEAPHPFAGELSVPNKYYSKIKELENRPDKVIRKEHVIVDTEENRKQTIERYNKSRKLFAELRDEYRLPIVPFEYVIAGSPKDAFIYTVAEKIVGENMAKMENIPPEVMVQMDAIYTKLAQYWLDKYRSGGDYLFDIHNLQMIYGHEYGINSAQNIPFIIDLDPYFREWKGWGDPDQSHVLDLQVFGCLATTVTEIEKLEVRSNPKTILTTARKLLHEALAEVIEKMPKDNEFYKEVLHAYQRSMLSSAAGGKV